MKKKHWIIVAVPTVILALTVFWMARTSGKSGEILLWEDLRQLDLVTKEVPDSLEKWDGEIVKIPGYVVPLADNLSTFQEFLLVPDAMACVHVPPPPPNQMVYVKLQSSIGWDQTFGPVWVTGKLQILISDSIYGDSAYTLKAAKVEPYEF